MSDASQFKKAYTAITNRFGTSYTKTRRTVTTDTLGYEISETTSSTTLIGDFQLITDEEDLRELGLTGNGNGRFYGKIEDDIQEDDLLTISGVYWQFKKRIEPDEIGVTTVSATWVLVRLDG